MQTTEPERDTSRPAPDEPEGDTVPSVPAESAPPALRWPGGPGSPDLPAGELHVWALDLDRGPASHLGLRTRLSRDERRRAFRCRRTAGIRRSVASRALLRELLGRYLGVPPGEIAFRYGSVGKPALAEPWARSGIHFNVSHSDRLALYAFARDVEVGVDLERTRPLPDLEAVACRFFSEAETEAFLRLEPALRRHAFYRAWTRKEAYVKAIGDGLTHGLDAFDVTLAPGEDARVLRADGDPEAQRRWRLVHLEPATGYTGALAVRGADVLCVRRWS